MKEKQLNYKKRKTSARWNKLKRKHVQNVINKCE